MVKVLKDMKKSRRIRLENLIFYDLSSQFSCSVVSDSL